MRQTSHRVLTGCARGGLLLSLLLLIGAPAAFAETAVIRATVKAGQVVVTWSLPSNDSRAAATEARHTATNIRWSTDPATVPSSGNNEGSTLACWLTGPSDGKHDCTGGRDLGANATSFTITGLAPGTYYVQLQTYGLKYVAQYDGLYHFNAYSNVVRVVVPRSGGGSSGGGTTGETATKTATATVTVSGPATVAGWKGDEWVEKQVGAGAVTLSEDDRLYSGARAVKLAIKEGRVVLAPHTQVWPQAGGWQVAGAPKGQFDSYVGEAWFSVPGSAKKQHRLLVSLYGFHVRTVGPAAFVVADGDHTPRVKVLAGKVDVSRKRDFRKRTTVSAGFEIFVEPAGKYGKLAKPKKFTPPKNPFWK